MTVKELKDILDVHEDEFRDFIQNQGGNVKIGELTLETIEAERVNAGVYNVFSVGEDLFRVEGYYDSWSGTDWEYNDITKVKAVVKQVTFYESI